MSDEFYDYGKTFAQPVDVRYEDTALIVVDMQYHDAARGRGLALALERLHPGSCDYFCDRVEQQVVPAIGRLLTHAREHGMRVIYLTLGSEHRDLRDMPERLRTAMRQVEREGGIEDLMWAGNPDFAIIEEIAPRDGDIVVNKTTFGAFNGSNFGEVLEAEGIRSLIFTGVTTACCIETTARDAADRGYGCVIVDEATAAFDAQAQEATLRTFHFNFGSVASTAEDAIAALSRTAAV